MAKNLKLNIKNAQLAEALKLNTIKKTVKRKKAEEATSEEAPAPIPQATTVEKVLNTTFDSPPPPIQERPLPVASAAPESFPAEKAVEKQQPPSFPSPRTVISAQQQPSTPTTTTPQESTYTPRPPYEKKSYPSTGYTQRSYPPREGGYERKSYPPREGGSGEQRTYPPREGGYERKSYPPREGASGEQRTYPPREGGYERKSYPPREGGERRPYPPREGGSGYTPRPYPPREGGAGYTPRPYTPREGGGERRPYTPREGGERRPYPPREGGAGYTPRPYTPREGGERRSFGPRTEGHAEFKKAFPSKSDEYKKTTPSRESITPKRTLKPREDEGIANKDFKDFKAQKKNLQTGSFDSRDRQGLRADSEDQKWRKKRSQKMRVVQEIEIVRPKNLKVRIPISVKDLASEMKLKSSQLITNLFMKGVVLTLNDFLDDPTTIQLLGHDFDCEITIDTSEEERVRITDKTIKQEIQENSPENLIIRSPVVAFMGHVDHGKTSLIDAIRKSNVAAGEAGAITQHIGAFKCHTNVGDITILDTPGHEAFSAMRTRGADVTDIIVLVIAGDEGMRAQTIEALQQAQTANVPIVVAINKSDKPSFDPEIVYRQLADHQLLPETWGGQTITVNCSAVTGAGIQSLVEMLALQAEILELKANPNSRARGTVIESEMHKGLGPVATVLVQNGTLRLGDSLVFSQNYARVKTMHDELGRELTEAGPSTPTKITGLSGLPVAGSEFIVVKDEKEAKDLAEKRIEGQRFQLMQQPKRATTESFLQDVSKGSPKKILNLILRADVQGSVEALKTSLSKIPTDKVELTIISAGVGEISESDVQLAQTSKATIIGFHTQIESHAAALIKESKVVVRLHDIIYHAVDDVKVIMTSMLDKLAQENQLGVALVKAVFKASQLGVIAGCIVTDGIIKRSCHVRVMRDNQVVWKGPISSLKKVKEDVKEVSKGHECGILLQNFNEIKVNDEMHAFEITYLKQEL